MVDLKSQYDRLKNEIDTAIQGVIDRSAFIRGEEVHVFAQQLGEYLEGTHVIPCGNGTDALQIALMALDFKPGDEVLVPAFTYIAAVEALALLGVTPVLVDVHPDTFQIDAGLLSSKISPKTKGIIPVHLYGQCADMGQIMAFARDNGLKVIEDAAQSLGASYTFGDGSQLPSGTIGDLGITSFFPSKTLGCFGDGGAVLIRNGALAESAQMIANHGQKKKYRHESIGVNSRLDTLQAAILLAKLPHLDSYISKRNQVAKAYNKAFAHHPQLRIPQRVPASTHVYHQFTLKVKDGLRDRLAQYLSGQGIPSMVYYPMPVHLQPAYAYLGHRAGDFPVAEQLCQEVLSLPIHTEMDKDQIEFIIYHVKKFFE